MMGHSRLPLAFLVLCALVFMNGCVPIYCTLKYGRTPTSQPLELFQWDTTSNRSHQPPLDQIALIQADQPGLWIIYNNNSGYRISTKQILLDDSGGYIETLPARDMRKTEPFVRFTADPEVYEKSNFSVVIEDDSYPQYLEVEAWLRQTFGRLIAPAMGKSGRAFIYDSFSRFACGAPRVAITTKHNDGSTSIRRFSLPRTEETHFVGYGTLISENGEFLYIYYHHSGSVLRLTAGK